MPTDYTPLGIALFLLTLTGVAILRGWLVPRSQIKRELEARDRQIEEIGKDRDYWRSAWMTESESRRHADGQVSDLLELARLATDRERTTVVAQALPAPRGELPDAAAGY